MDIGAQTYGLVQSILRNGLDHAYRPAPPATDRLREIGLAGMARALEEQRRHADAPPTSATRTASSRWSNVRHWSATQARCHPITVCGPGPNKLPRRMSTIVCQWRSYFGSPAHCVLSLRYTAFRTRVAEAGIRHGHTWSASASSAD